ncbi:MAG: hypothetical protein ACKOAH_23140 [Pirellula sp.]
MSNLRSEFREFLLRIANNKLKYEDWDCFAVSHYDDEEIERTRRSIVKRSLDFPDWQVGWIPRDFSDTARALAECLREISTDSIFYWPEWSGFLPDGTLHVKASWYDEDSHSTGFLELSATDPDYSFWKWLVSDRKLSKGIKSATEINTLKDHFSKHAK